MAISLQKGQKIDLTKGKAGLSNVMVGLGWDPVEQNKSFLRSLFGSNDANIDCDASVLMLDENGRLINQHSIIYYGNLHSQCQSVQHTGDNLTGDGAGDDEQIKVNLKQIPASIHRLLFIVNIFDAKNRNQHFGMIKNAYIRIFEPKSGELVRYDLSDEYDGRTCLIPGELYRYQGEWKFSAIGEGTNDGALKDIVNKYL